MWPPGEPAVPLPSRVAAPWQHRTSTASGVNRITDSSGSHGTARPSTCTERMHAGAARPREQLRCKASARMWIHPSGTAAPPSPDACRGCMPGAHPRLPAHQSMEACRLSRAGRAMTASYRGRRPTSLPTRPWKHSPAAPHTLPTPEHIRGVCMITMHRQLCRHVIAPRRIRCGRRCRVC